MVSQETFYPQQILFVEQETMRLYVEMIQLIESRKQGWVRPIALQVVPNGAIAVTGDPQEPEPEILDLRQDSDLILPLAVFHPALDTDYLPLLLQLKEFKPDAVGCPHSTAKHLLRDFLKKLWQANPELFQPHQGSEAIA